MLTMRRSLSFGVVCYPEKSLLFGHLLVIIFGYYFISIIMVCCVSMHAVQTIKWKDKFISKQAEYNFGSVNKEIIIK